MENKSLGQGFVEVLMDSSEAIKVLAEISCRGCKSLDTDNSCISRDIRCFMAKKTAIAALEKQIPKKPKMEYDGVITKEYCPFCSNSLFPNDRFCQWCGQAIDWSEDGEK